MYRENSVFRVETSLGRHALCLHRPGYHSDATLSSGLDGNEDMQVPTPMPTPEVASDPARRSSLLSWLPDQPMGDTRRPLDFAGPARVSICLAV